MANTTYFGWETPDDTDLVKDGAAAIRTLGSAIDTSMQDLEGGTTGQILSKTSNTDMDFTWITNDVGDITAVTAGTGISGGGTTGAVTITNSMATAITTAGDTLYGTGSGTFSRLGIGTAGQVLKVNSGATAPEWAAAGGASGMTLIQRSSFSNVANTSTTFDGVFTSTYKVYLIQFEGIEAATPADDLQMVMRYSGTSQTSAYYTSNALCPPNSVTFTNQGNSNAGVMALSNFSGDSSDAITGNLTVYKVGNASETCSVVGDFVSRNTGNQFRVSSVNVTARTYTGFLLQSSSTNITGTVSVYGLATA